MLTGGDGDDTFIISIRKLLSSVFSSGEERDNDRYGKWSDVNMKSITVGNEEEDAVICIQIDQMDGRNLTERGKNIKKRW